MAVRVALAQAVPPPLTTTGVVPSTTRVTILLRLLQVVLPVMRKEISLLVDILMNALVVTSLLLAIIPDSYVIMRKTLREKINF